MTRPLCVMLVATEASGDDRGAGLAKSLRARLGDKVRFVGAGGAQMAAQGVESLFDIAQLSILGVVDALAVYPRAMKLVDQTVALAAREKPDVVVLIDSWAFSLRVANRLRKLDPSIPLVKYVAPQVWAWRRGRAKVLARSVDHLLSIHTFDAPYFEAEGLPTTFVGNAALKVDFSAADPARLRAEHDIAPEAPILLVLPGSRPSEINRVLPSFAEAALLLKASRPDLEIVIPAAPTVAEAVKAQVAGWPRRAHVVEGEQAKLDSMKAATVAMACSGTVTIELALAGCPMVIGYRIDKLTYALVNRLVRRPITLFNIAAGEIVAPELIQDDCTPQALAREIALRLDDPALCARQVAAQFAALETMGRGGPDPSDAAADAILKILAGRPRG
ncbi:lipid-A-disaccharide synthase [Phenylobacterium sp.]|uniref:lipid-A-disaccharide synthase n=1 Tax=Phenylobacterium sp. TaxID=1871053 RepID=UPI002721C61D|nr:lipid-A-disaccharide synthase [Phenylobacterium sp.]MDO8379682.1 lipid-A-disaccharide synthase [Phenylobacterium sp.]